MTNYTFRLVWACLLLLGLLTLGACGAQEAELAPTACGTQEPGLTFETIELTEFGARYEGKDPKVEVVGELDAIHSLWSQVSSEVMAELQRTDYDHYLVLILFHGRRNDTPHHPGAEIRGVTYFHDTLQIHAHFYEDDPGRESRCVVSSPYHAIRIPRDGLPETALAVRVYSDDKLLLQDSFLLDVTPWYSPTPTSSPTLDLYYPVPSTPGPTCTPHAYDLYPVPGKPSPAPRS